MGLTDDQIERARAMASKGKVVAPVIVELLAEEVQALRLYPRWGATFVTYTPGELARLGPVVDEERSLMIFERTSPLMEARFVRLTKTEALELLALLQRNELVVRHWVTSQGAH